MTDRLSDALRAWVEHEAGERVRSAVRIGRGASRQIWALELDTRELVVRVDSGDGPVAGTPLTLAREGSVYRHLADTDLPVPALSAIHPDATALLLDRAPGDERTKGLDREARRAVAADYGRCLARLHATDASALAGTELAVPDGISATAHDLGLWRDISETRSGTAASPITSAALAALATSVPAAQRTTLCHGDAGPGNFLHDGRRVTAMLDWEFAHLGDPHDDLAWVVVRNQVLRHPLDAIVTLRAWQDATGEAIDADRVEWFRALVLTRMLVSCDATVAWARHDADADISVQAILRPYLTAALGEALRRAGCGADIDELERDARRAWRTSTVAELLDDPADLDDIGALL